MVLFATETIAIPIAIAVVAVIALAVGGATYMMLKPSTKVDGVEKPPVLMDGRQEAASTSNPNYGLNKEIKVQLRRGKQGKLEYFSNN